MCRKMETEEEKVLPFYSSSLSTEEEEKAAAVEAEAPSEELAEVKSTACQIAAIKVCLLQVMHKYASLQNFWKRYNKVLLDKMALDKEKEKLFEENAKLKVLLKQYLDGKNNFPMS